MANKKLFFCLNNVEPQFIFAAGKDSASHGQNKMKNAFFHFLCHDDAYRNSTAKNSHARARGR